MTADRVFGDHEADAMYEAIASRLALASPHVGLGADFLQELRDERRLLVARRLELNLALARLYDAVRGNHDDGGDMKHLDEAMSGARKALDV
jgi:hypothetical protein